ncbi:hypothetical protein C9374_009212 [Naegleria lovaniensis]|uniref:Uncharacterized protein n=1 Tax=Naegleria lovaniensis TaxID=51637 RepID=A0AA88KH12_NAELO|nr:uncharacterized protein C9374_009212 [Naegleria lovaniensis]KAG2377696.1 hypothetical protein C9374_009212 [Naegleria lovaniensis]
MNLHVWSLVAPTTSRIMCRKQQQPLGAIMMVALLAVVMIMSSSCAAESLVHAPTNHHITIQQVAFQLTESGFSMRFKALDRSSQQVHEGTAIRYKNEKTESLNVILESGILGMMTFFDSRSLHAFMKPVQEGGVEISQHIDKSNGVTQCIHINYDAPWNAFDNGMGLSKMLNKVTFKAVPPKSVTFDKEVNTHCVNNKLDMYSFSFMDESMVLCANGTTPVFIISKSLVVSISEFTLTEEKTGFSAQPTLHEKLFLDQMDHLVSNCTYYDRKYLAEYFGKKNIHAKQDTTARDILEKYLTKYRVSAKYGLPLPIIEEKASYRLSLDSSQRRSSSNEGSLWFLNEQESCSSGHMRDEKSCVSYLTRKSSGAAQSKPTCIFLHGAGGQEDLPPQKDFKEYWGNVLAYTDHCGDVWFGRRDTKNRGWDDESLQDYYCSTALLGSGNSTKIQNTLLYTHSMGNLIIAAAFMKGKCSIDMSTSQWFTMGAPFNGSVVSRTLQNICHDYYYNNFPLNLKALYGFIATVGGYCVKGTPNAYQSYISVEEGYCSPQGVCIHDLYEHTDPYDTGRLCGDDPIGLLTHYSIALEIVHWVADYGTTSDGFVTFKSCQMDEEKKFSDNGPSTDWYKAMVNHADETCRNGDGWWGSDRKPCSFYKKQ